MEKHILRVDTGADVAAHLEAVSVRSIQHGRHQIFSRFPVVIS